MNLKSAINIRKQIFSFLVGFLFVSSFISPVLANDDDEWEERPLLSLVDKETANRFGYIAILFLIIGGLYIVVKRTHILSKRFINSEKYPKVPKFTAAVYSKTRLPLFYTHLGINFLATVVAFIHGLSVELEGSMVIFSGIICGFFILLLSVSGVIIWRKFWPFWPNKESKKLIRAAHRQWLFTTIVIITLIAHLVFFND